MPTLMAYYMLIQELCQWSWHIYCICKCHANSLWHTYCICQNHAKSYGIDIAYANIMPNNSIPPPYPKGRSMGPRVDYPKTRYSSILSAVVILRLRLISNGSKCLAGLEHMWMFSKTSLGIFLYSIPRSLITIT